MFLFDRQISIVIAERGQIVGTTTPLRVDFIVNKSIDEKQNTADISIYNLNDQTRLGIDRNNLNISLSTGYAQAVGLELLYSGQIARVLHNAAPPDMITNVQCGDGLEVIANRFVQESFSPGTTVNDVISYLQAQAAIPVKLNNINSGDQYSNGITISEPWYSSITKVLNRIGASWSIQDGELLLLSNGTYLSDEIVFLTPENGMLKSPQLITIDAAEIETPEQEGTTGIRVECLLNPRIRPATVIDVTAKFYSGRYKVVQVNHHGSNYTNEWISTIDAEVISA